MPIMSMLAVGNPAAAESAADWPMFGQNIENTASYPNTSIGVDNVGLLRTRWVFTTGSDVSARAAVVDGVAYFPDWGGNLYAVNAGTGALIWSKNISTDYLSGTPGSTVVSRSSPAIDVDTGVLYIGTREGADLLAIRSSDGSLVWSHKLDDHPKAIDTGSPVVYNGVVYVGVSSGEEYAASKPSYPCCSFRGSVVALDASSGQQIWKTYTVPEGYSGGAVWSSTIVPDSADGLVFATTGNNYSTPTDPNFVTCINDGGSEPDCLSPDDHIDSIIAMKIDDGSIAWSQRLADADDWNAACNVSGANCPTPTGPDNDFGSGVNLITYQSATGPVTILGAGQKSGIYSAFDPATGRVLWATQIGPDGGFGGIMWGSASDGERIYVAEANSNHQTYALTPSGKTTSSGSWVALDPATGSILWQTADPNGASDQGPLTVANGVVYAPSMAAKTKRTPNMFALDAATGNVLWSFASGGSVIAGAVVVDDTVFWGSGYTHIPTPGNVGNTKFFAFSVGQPASTPWAALSAIGTHDPLLIASIHTTLPQSAPAGFLVYRDRSVSLTNVKLISLTVAGIQSILQGTADLPDSTPVRFTLDARASYPTPTVRLRLSNGYDSGEQHVALLLISPHP